MLQPRRNVSKTDSDSGEQSAITQGDGWRGLRSNGRALFRGLLLVVFTLPLLYVALSLGWRPLSAWQSTLVEQSSDPDNIVRGARAVASSANVYATVDPPLRYVPLAVLFVIFDPGTFAAQALTQTYTTVLNFVVLPLTLGALLWRVADWESAFLTLLGFMIWQWLGITENAYYDGFWHYVFVFPLVFLTLLLLHDCLQEEDTIHRRLRATGVGLLVGAIGLNQYVYGALTALVIFVAFVFHRRWVDLGLSGSVGALCGVALLLSPGRTKSFVAQSAIGRLGIEQWSLAVLASGVVDVLTTPSYLLFLLIGLGGGALFIVSERRVSDTGVIEASLLVYGSVGIVATLLVHPRWFAQLSIYVFQYLILGTVVTLALSTLRDLQPPGWSYVGRCLSSPLQLPWAAVWAVTWVIAAAASVLLIPIQAP